jgi:hypothetical protein
MQPGTTACRGGESPPLPLALPNFLTYSLLPSDLLAMGFFLPVALRPLPRRHLNDPGGTVRGQCSASHCFRIIVRKPAV